MKRKAVNITAVGSDPICDGDTQGKLHNIVGGKLLNAGGGGSRVSQRASLWYRFLNSSQEKQYISNTKIDSSLYQHMYFAVA